MKDGDEVRRVCGTVFGAVDDKVVMYLDTGGRLTWTIEEAKQNLAGFEEIGATPDFLEGIEKAIAEAESHE